MRWYQVIISLSSQSSELMLPAGSDINKAIDIGKRYLSEFGDLQSHFRVVTVNEANDDSIDCVYSSHRDHKFNNQYRLEKCEQALGFREECTAVNLPAFLKKQAC